MIYWAFLLLAIGLFVVVLELFLPSGGMLGIFASALIITSIVLGFMDGLKSGALILLITVIALPALLGAMVKIWPHTPLGKMILLKDLKPEDVLPNRRHAERRASLEGQLGVAKTKMLPSGTVVINGEKYDARLEMPGWAQSGFDDSKWEKVEILDHSKDILVAPQGPPVKAIEEIKPKKLITTPKGEIVLDLGQNIVGWARMKVKGPEGHKVTLKFAEVLVHQVPIRD